MDRISDERLVELASNAEYTANLMDGIDSVVKQQHEQVASALRELQQLRKAGLVEALEPLAAIPLEDFGWKRPDQPITGWNKHTIYVRDVQAARAARATAKGAI